MTVVHATKGAWNCEVGRPDEAEGADDFLPGVRDVGLGVELVLSVDAAENLPAADAFGDGRDADKEVIALLLAFQARVQVADGPRQPLLEGILRAKGNLAAHEDAELIDLLPLIGQGQQRADLEVAGGDVDLAGELAPVVEVLADLPLGVAVVDDEQFTARLAGPVRHSVSLAIAAGRRGRKRLGRSSPPAAA